MRQATSPSDNRVKVKNASIVKMFDEYLSERLKQAEGDRQPHFRAVHFKKLFGIDGKLIETFKRDKLLPKSHLGWWKWEDVVKLMEFLR